MVNGKYSLSLIFLCFFLSVLHNADAYVSLQQNDSAISYYRAGTEHYRLRNYKEAVAAFKKAIVLNSDYVEAYRELGNAYFSLTEYWKAYETYVQARSIALYKHAYEHAGGPPVFTSKG